MNLRKSGEDYLEAIYVLKKQKGVVHSVDVARHMDYSKPSVSRAVNNLQDDGYLVMQEGGELILTEKGLLAAENIYNRHTILTELLCAIGVCEKTADEDACRMEHAISEETFACIKVIHSKYLATLMEKSK